MRENFFNSGSVSKLFHLFGQQYCGSLLPVHDSEADFPRRVEIKPSGPHSINKDSQYLLDPHPPKGELEI